VIGPGKYDDICTEVRKKTKARCVIVIIIDGDKGSGFSGQGDPLTLVNMPMMLEDVAAGIRKEGIRRKDRI